MENAENSGASSRFSTADDSVPVIALNYMNLRDGACIKEIYSVLYGYPMKTSCHYQVIV